MSLSSLTSMHRIQLKQIEINDESAIRRHYKSLITLRRTFEMSIRSWYLTNIEKEVGYMKIEENKKLKILKLDKKKIKKLFFGFYLSKKLYNSIFNFSNSFMSFIIHVQFNIRNFQHSIIEITTISCHSRTFR